jgi:hypothetical protein
VRRSIQSSRHARPTDPRDDRALANSPDARRRLPSSALSAAPKEIAEHVADVAPDANGRTAEIHAGTNGWTCLADEPDTPRLDPMCLDKTSMQRAQSLMSHAAPWRLGGLHPFATRLHFPTRRERWPRG